MGKKTFEEKRDFLNSSSYNLGRGVRKLEKGIAALTGKETYDSR